jgi:DNA-binding MarR family transcriptional regulator
MLIISIADDQASRYAPSVSIDLGPGPAASRRLGYLFKHAMMQMEALNAPALASQGIDARELGVMLLLADHEPTSQQQSAQRLGVDRTTMVALIDTLERKGLVTRHPDAVDRRRNVVELTDTGRDVLRQATKASDGAERALLSPLSAAAANDLRTALQQILLATRDSGALEETNQGSV